MKAVTSGRRVRLAHHVVELDDGHSVGVSLGGHGMPLVFLHGLGLSRRAYLRLLSRVAGLGFLVVAVDAAGHGDTRDLSCDNSDFTDRVDLVIRTLDALGIDRAVFAGHSMGGRMALHLAAVVPDRALAVVLFDAAAGASFDAAVSIVMRSPRQMIRTVAGAVSDMHGDPFHMKVDALGRYLRMLGAVLLGRVLPQSGFTGAARAIMRSGQSTPLLRAMRDRHIPTMVLHGECDAIVPFESACDVADHTNATLYRVRGACHSWLIANPGHGADSVRQLLDGPLGAVLQSTAAQLGMNDWRDSGEWERALIKPEAWVRRVNDGIHLIGVDEDDPVGMEVVRRAVRLPTVEHVAAVSSLCRSRNARTA
ncbi:alpha/beta hydrolase [Mycobacterium sp. 21AC1]|uniref:alpha/beta fold hydrolase n=1 Tax=[Mycobacterium] appelbergii TaxID=2939269 RepID=UPI002938D7E0|nr:alpha/beta hydrolase [Mycobacterium sp. 21AC1]MDV3126946.1 alpha/beta hydrolase [Mycobacterium sp. 21AC1]